MNEVEGGGGHATMTHGRWRAKFCFLPSFLRFLSLSSGIHTAALPFPESHHSSSLRPVTIHVSSLFNPRGAVRALFLFYRSLFFLSLSLSLSLSFFFSLLIFFSPLRANPIGRSMRNGQRRRRRRRWTGCR